MRAVVLLVALTTGTKTLRAQQDAALADAGEAPDAGAPAQPPTPEPQLTGKTRSVAQVRDGSELARHIDAALAQLKGLARHAEVDGLGELTTETRHRDRALRAEAAETRARLLQVTQLAVITEVERTWLRRKAEVNQSRDRIDEQAAAVSKAHAGALELTTEWEHAQTRFAGDDLPVALAERMAMVLEQAREVSRALEQRKGMLLELQAMTLATESRIDGALERVQARRITLDRRFWRRVEPPIWSVLGGVRTPAEASLESRVRIARRYLERKAEPLALQLLVLVLVVVMLRRAAASRQHEERQSSILGSVREGPVLRHPVGAGLLVYGLMTVVLHPTAPALVVMPIAVLALAGALRVIRGGAPATPLWLYGLPLGLALLGVTRMVADASAPGLGRLLYELELFALGTGLLTIARRHIFAQVPATGRWLPQVEGVTQALAGVAVAAVVADALGFALVAHVLGSGALEATYLGITFTAGYWVLCATIAVGLRMPLMQRSHIIRNHRQLLERRAAAAARLAAVAGWVVYSLDGFLIRDRVLDAVLGIFRAELSVGELSISLGDVAAFGLTIAASIYVARLIAFLLDEGLWPRVELPRGVPYAITTTSRYVVLLVGFMMAMAAGGLDMGKATVLAGAFGVGIGFGLQNIVNNFVSGLILLYERPIKRGDAVEVGDLVGEVKRIGIRSSTVRTWQGAEVIVPNATLISDNVVNWTLSDRRRRIDVPVGVAYGTDPTRVIELLRETAQAHESVLSTPAPVVLFTAFGASSLDFEVRSWTARYDDWLTIRSELTVRINDALVKEGIEIPFPQRDLHLRSVDDGAARSLKSPPGDEGE